MAEPRLTESLAARAASAAALLQVARRTHLAPLGVENFFELFLSFVPEFEPLFREHVSDNQAVLPHVLMGDVARFLEDSLSSPAPAPLSSAARGVLARAAAVLEAGMRSPDPRLQELVSVGFLEGVESEPYMPRLVPFLGRALRRELRARRLS